MFVIKYQLLNDQASVPYRAGPSDAGIDLKSSESTHIWPRSRILVRTGLALEIPEGYYGRIAPRSGLALKNGIDVLAGVIDSTYRGEIMVLLYNTDQHKKFTINIGDRIAQLIIEKHYNFEFVHKELSSSIRSDKGFGSSGNK